MEYRCLVVGDPVSEPGALARLLLGSAFPPAEVRTLKRRRSLYQIRSMEFQNHTIAAAISDPPLEECELTLSSPSMPSLDIVVHVRVTSGDGALLPTGHVDAADDLSHFLRRPPHCIVVCFNPCSMRSFSKLKQEWTHAVVTYMQHNKSQQDFSQALFSQDSGLPLSHTGNISSLAVQPSLHEAFPESPVTSLEENYFSFPTDGEKDARPTILLIATRGELLLDAFDSTPVVDLPTSMEVAEVAYQLGAKGYIEMNSVDWLERVDDLRLAVARACVGELTESPVVDVNTIYNHNRESVARTLQTLAENDNLPSSDGHSDDEEENLPQKEEERADTLDAKGSNPEEAPQKVPEKIPHRSQWTFRYHPVHKRVYYVNRKTRESQYSRPKEYDGKEPPVDKKGRYTGSRRGTRATSGNDLTKDDQAEGVVESESSVLVDVEAKSDNGKEEGHHSPTTSSSEDQQCGGTEEESTTLLPPPSTVQRRSTLMDQLESARSELEALQEQRASHAVLREQLQSELDEWQEKEQIQAEEQYRVMHDLEKEELELRGVLGGFEYQLGGNVESMLNTYTEALQLQGNATQSFTEMVPLHLSSGALSHELEARQTELREEQTQMTNAYDVLSRESALFYEEKRHERQLQRQRADGVSRQNAILTEKTELEYELSLMEEECEQLQHTIERMEEQAQLVDAIGQHRALRIKKLVTLMESQEAYLDRQLQTLKESHSREERTKQYIMAQVQGNEDHKEEREFSADVEDLLEQQRTAVQSDLQVVAEEVSTAIITKAVRLVSIVKRAAEVQRELSALRKEELTQQKFLQGELSVARAVRLEAMRSVYGEPHTTTSVATNNAYTYYDTCTTLTNQWESYDTRVVQPLLKECRSLLQNEVFETSRKKKSHDNDDGLFQACITRLVQCCGEEVTASSKPIVEEVVHYQSEKDTLRRPHHSRESDLNKMGLMDSGASDTEEPHSMEETKVRGLLSECYTQYVALLTDAVQKKLYT
ncbi:hypothetical protein ADEAN_000915900 [Angomonas deanei]|uniref:WW domain-containing protein n=1 Tax=Angomonas deanei TaxID=59799 RepID=A0A7G2CR56_9TRYP|nr:hypothetical protein ADEAN_000915900 [Angomonas deanei]